jgi:hypothetical protein
MYVGIIIMFEWTVGRGVLSNGIKLIKTLKTSSVNQKEGSFEALRPKSE